LRKWISFVLGFLLLFMAVMPVYADGDSIFATISKLYGTPYKSGGSTPDGFDCSGFTRYVFASVGIELPRSSKEQYKVGKAVAKSDLQPGDLVFFNTNGKSVSHVGIYIGDNMFAHSSSSSGVIKTSLNDPYYWSKRYVGAKRVLPDTK
jgi:probable lipoprotein NlpC